MDIQIKSHSNNEEKYQWYKEMIGQTFEVTAINKLTPKTKEFMVRTQDGTDKPVLSTDSKIMWNFNLEGK